MKTVLFVPGYQEDIDSRDYRSLIKMIEDVGYDVKLISINWVRTTIDDWAMELEAEYSRYSQNETILAGFSFGAMTALVASTKRNPVELWLFSLSSYFEDDITSRNMKKSWLSSLGHRRISAFGKLNYKELASKIDCKVLLFVGQEEIDKWPTMQYRTSESTKYLQNAKLTIIEGVGHDVADPRYVSAINQQI